MWDLMPYTPAPQHQGGIFQEMVPWYIRSGKVIYMNIISLQVNTDFLKELCILLMALPKCFSLRAGFCNV